MRCVNFIVLSKSFGSGAQTVAATAGRPIIGGMAEQGRVCRNRRHHWNWLLAMPLVLLVHPGLYARMTPELFGFPFFYWYQFAAAIATALLTGVVYWLTRGPENLQD